MDAGSHEEDPEQDVVGSSTAKQAPYNKEDILDRADVPNRSNQRLGRTEREKGRNGLFRSNNDDDEQAHLMGTPRQSKAAGSQEDTLDEGEDVFQDPTAGVSFGGPASLFKTVMQQSHTKPPVSVPNHHEETLPTSTIPDRDVRMEAHTTPGKPPAQRPPQNPDSLFSPTGFQMMDFLHQAEDSPFQPNKAGAATPSSSMPTPGTAASKEASDEGPTLVHMMFSKDDSVASEPRPIAVHDVSLKRGVTLDIPLSEESTSNATSEASSTNWEQVSAESIISASSSLETLWSLQSTEQHALGTLEYWQYPSTSFLTSAKSTGNNSSNPKRLRPNDASTTTDGRRLRQRRKSVDNIVTTDQSRSSFSLVGGSNNSKLWMNDWNTNMGNENTRFSMSSSSWSPMEGQSRMSQFLNTDGNQRRRRESTTAASTGGENAPLSTETIYQQRSRHALHTLQTWRRQRSTQKKLEDTQQWQEWQQAFQSLFRRWIGKIRQYHHEKNRSTKASNTDDNNDDSKFLRTRREMDPKQLEDAYFYLCGVGYTMLFRECPGKPQPQILLSSTDVRARERLRQLGVPLHFLGNPLHGHIASSTKDGEQEEHSNDRFVSLDDEETFWRHFQQASDASLQQRPKEKSKGRPEKDSKAGGPVLDSPQIRNELAALRRSQMMGQTVGADIYVAQASQSKSKLQKQELLQRRHERQKQLPPLVVTGWDACLAVGEALLHASWPVNIVANDASANQSSMGKSSWPIRSSTQQEHLHPISPENLPVILCRKLGPFLHGKLVQLQINNSIHNNEGNRRRKIHVEGWILPCAFREIVQASTHWALQTRTGNGALDDDEEEDEFEEHEPEIRWTLQAHLHEGLNGDPMQVEFLTGVAHSGLFNGKTTAEQALEGTGDALRKSNEKTTHACICGSRQVVSAMVMQQEHAVEGGVLTAELQTVGVS